MFKKVTKKIKNSVLQTGIANLSIFKSKNVTVNQIQAMDQMQLYLQRQEFDKAADLLRQMNTLFDSGHPCAPFWKYDLRSDENGRKFLSHVPAFPGAEKLMPLTGKMKVAIPPVYKKFKNMKELLDFSYGTQQEIELDLKSFKAWIGETLIDEIEGNENNRNKIKIIPNKFPAPRPMKLYLKDSTWSIDYLLMGVEKILDSTITLNNHQQAEAPIYVEMIIDINLLTAKLNITISDNGSSSVKNILKLHGLMDNDKKTDKPKLALKLLESDTDLFIGPSWNFDNKSPDEEVFIDFLKKIYYIEQEFNIEFIIPNRNFTNEEIHNINVIYSSLRGNPSKIKIKGAITLTLDNGLEIEELFKIHDKYNSFNANLTIVSNENFDLLGIKFKSISNTVYLEKVKLDKPEKLRKLSMLLDGGEPLSLKLLPSSSKSIIIERLFVELAKI